MKTKQEIIDSEPVFLDIFSDAESVFNEFQVFGFKSYGNRENPKMPENIRILFAWYNYEDYSGSAFVLYHDIDKKELFEVHGGHCSCYGLEDQWNPEVFSIEGTVYSIKNGSGYSYEAYMKPLGAFLGIE